MVGDTNDNPSLSERQLREGQRNAQLQNVIFRRLGCSGHLGLRRVSVAVENDRVVLSGTVPSYYLKQMAQETAKDACPHRRVYNDLNVVRAN